MDAKLLLNAKKDLPLYFADFKNFWDATSIHYSDDELLACYANTLIFKNWKISLNHIGNHDLDSLLDEINEDINTSFILAHFGLYRSSHMHLRSVIELSLQCLYFYHHEVELLQWKEADFRIKHEELTGYLKKHPTLKDTSAVSLIGNITTKWIKFSKYIHAEAPIYFQTSLNSRTSKSISSKDFNIWKSNFVFTGSKLNKVFLLFFKNELRRFPTQQQEILMRNLSAEDLLELGF